MLTMYQTPAAWGLPNISPFCLKLETYLRMAGIAYQTRAGNPLRAPRGKVPYIEMDGQLICDSQRIIEALKRKFGDALDQHQSPVALARGHLVRRMLEEGTYFVIIYTRWQNADGWRAYKPTLEAELPRFIGGLALEVIRRQVAKSAYAQGTLRHPPEVIYAMGNADFDAVAAELGDKPYLLGDKPSSVDAAVYAFTASVLGFPVDSPFKRHLAAIPTLVAYTERMQQRFFPHDRPPGKG